MLSVKNLSFRFASTTILDRVEFELERGAITCLVGTNGCGKTTLLNIISGFLRPDQGSVKLKEVEIVGLQPFKIGRLGIGRTFQDLRVIEKLTVKENVLLAVPEKSEERLSACFVPRRFSRRRDAHIDGVAKEILADFFLTPVADHLASDISYGQKKLLNLACCFSTGADLLLLDEPVAGVSPEYRDTISDRLLGLRRDGKTVLLIEHQADFLDRVGEKFFLLEEARLHETGCPT